MSFHIVNIDSPQASLSCRDGQLTCKTAEGEKRLPLEDVASIIITSFSAQIHSNLFLEAAKHGVALIICEAFKPVSLVLPANRSTDTLLSRAQLSLDEKKRARLWQLTVDAKCRNQSSLAAHLAPTDIALPALASEAASRKPHKEAHCAKLFWQVFGRSLGEKDFSRERSLSGIEARNQHPQEGAGSYATKHKRTATERHPYLSTEAPRIGRRSWNGDPGPISQSLARPIYDVPATPRHRVTAISARNTTSAA